MTSANKITYTSILDLKMLIMVNKIMLNSFVQLTVATSFERQLKIITCKKEGKKRKIPPPPKISAQHLCLQILPYSSAIIVSDFLYIC